MADLTYSTGTGTEYAEQILGGQVTINSVSFIGGADQRRIFSEGEANAPDLAPGNTGVIFSTGNAVSFNDNDSVNQELSTTEGQVTDPDAASLAPGFTTSDAAGIEIEFTADFTGEIQIQLTFATDEYPEWINGGFSDVAAIYLDDGSGSGMQLVPITGTTSGFFNVDSINNTPVINNNPNTAPTQDQSDFDGLQVERFVTLNVVDGQTYTIKVVVSDVGDTFFDSALLLNALCFCQGTLIRTEHGDQLIETLSVGDRLLTRDGGFQDIIWMGQSRHAAHGAIAPIRLKAGVLGNGHDLYVSPQHRILISDWRAELLFGEPEVLVPAKDLLNDDTIVRCHKTQPVYYHLLLKDHHLVCSNGIWTESFFPGKSAMGALSPAALADLKAAVPDLFECEDSFHLRAPQPKSSAARIVKQFL